MESRSDSASNTGGSDSDTSSQAEGMSYELGETTNKNVKLIALRNSENGSSSYLSSSETDKDMDMSVRSAYDKDNHGAYNYEFINQGMTSDATEVCSLDVFWEAKRRRSLQSETSLAILRRGLSGLGEPKTTIGGPHVTTGQPPVQPQAKLQLPVHNGQKKNRSHSTGTMSSSTSSVSLLSSSQFLSIPSSPWYGSSISDEDREDTYSTSSEPVNRIIRSGSASDILTGSKGMFYRRSTAPSVVVPKSNVGMLRAQFENINLPKMMVNGITDADCMEERRPIFV